MRGLVPLTALILMLFGIIGYYSLHLIDNRVHMLFLTIGLVLAVGSLVNSRRNKR